MNKFSERHFLMLQGPHGPFFHQLGRMLSVAGASVWQVAFNRGDAVFWPDKDTLIPFTDPLEMWCERLVRMIEEHAITDIVLYGDTRPIHAQAVKIAKERGLMVHVFEEGYLRPYWVTYERGGTNGNSCLMDTSVPEMRAALASTEIEFPDAPPRWGDMRQHMFYGALYHFFILFGNGAYKNFRPHRDQSVMQEFRLYLRRLMFLPLDAARRIAATVRVRNSGFPIHLVLLQLEHDASFRFHSPFKSQTEFIDMVASAFAKGAPKHHHLVFKAHPLEDGRAPIETTIRDACQKYGIDERVHYIRGGKLAGLLGQARSAVTVNSTAAQQVLWRGLPLKIFGAAVYDKPEFISAQPLQDFFFAPQRPDTRAYRDYRHYLLETSQVPGGFYSVRGRKLLMRQVVDMILAPQDPYDALVDGSAAPRQQLHAIR